VSGFKWGYIAAIAALVISVLLGIIFGVRPFYIFLRALIFAAVFFGIGFGTRLIINAFMPELLSLEEEPVIHEKNQPGSRVNITLDSTGEYAVPEMYKDSDSNELGNIEDLVSGAFKPRVVAEPPSRKKSPFEELESIDGKKENDYNDTGDSWTAFEPDSLDVFTTRPSANAPPAKQAFSPSFGNDVGLGGLPDLDAMATAFSGGGESRFSSAPAAGSGVSMLEPVDEQLFEGPAATRHVPKAGKSQQLEGNFNPKELAQGIRAALNKDK